MATRRRPAFDDKLARIAALAALPSEAAAPELRRFLADPNGYLVGEAAKVVAALDLRALVPDLSAAFSRLLAASDPIAADKGCHAKKRIIEALLELDVFAPDVYLAGIRYVQPEPAFGEPVDTAAPLRGLCAYALIRSDHPDALLEVAPLLMDREPDARAAAAAALGVSGVELAAAPLHVKVLAGDKEPDVLGACYKALLGLAPRRYLPLVAAALNEGEEAAAIALGESRLPDALPVLKSALSSWAGARMQDSVLLGISLLRTEEALSYLVSLLESAPEAQAVEALAALALHRHDERLVERIRKAVEGRGSRKLSKALQERFGD